jgi:hypothetical protein
MEVTSHMPGAATHIAHQTDIAHARRKTIEQVPVKRLVLQLLENAPDVFVRYSVVASLGVHVRWCGIPSNENKISHGYWERARGGIEGL